MRPLLSFPLTCLLLFPCLAPAQEVQRFRQWMEGQEVGGMEETHGKTPAGERIEQREWTQLERLGNTVKQETVESIVKSPDGSLTITWKVSLSAEPLLGEATWSPKTPGMLHVAVKGAVPADLQVPAGALLWPDEVESVIRTAARELKPIHFTEFASSAQQWAQSDLQPIGPEALPGFPDTVHFHGTVHVGKLSSELDAWVSPRSGDVKHIDKIGGLTVLTQREELPPPASTAGVPSFFERTLAKLPHHPFLPWIREVELHWQGPGNQDLPQDDQQAKLGTNRYRVKAAAEPNASEAAQMPVEGTPAAEDAPFLAQSPLVQFKDPVFNGLMVRLNPPKNATRWELAKRVTPFVFEWITEKDMSVGFASAQEVARIPRGDCTEHGVLAVALLRRLGVPARGVVGWVGLGDLLGLHFWVEVKLGDRWVPVDPTFDQAPASALRLKLGTTDLANLASVGWDAATLSFLDGAWVPEKPWAETIRADGDALTLPGVVTINVTGGRWSQKDGHIQLALASTHEVEAVTRPGSQQLKGALLLLGATSARRGWWSPTSRMLWMELDGKRWLQVDRMDQPTAFKYLDLIETRFP